MHYSLLSANCWLLTIHDSLLTTHLLTTHPSPLTPHRVRQAGLGRITEDTPQYQGVVVLNMADVPLGFGKWLGLGLGWRLGLGLKCAARLR